MQAAQPHHPEARFQSPEELREHYRRPSTRRAAEIVQWEPRENAHLLDILDKDLPPARLIEKVAAERGLRPDQLTGPCMLRHVVAARWEAIARVKLIRPTFSLCRIGKLFGNRDHTTILNALSKMSMMPKFEEAKPLLVRWTAEQDETLRALWAEGHSCTTIAKMMGGSITKSAVIGRVRRMKLPTRKPQSPTTTEKRPHGGHLSAEGIVSRVKVRKAAVARSDSPIDRDDTLTSRAMRSAVWRDRGGSLSFDDLRRGDCRCRWPFDAANGVRYCGGRTVTGVSYCEEHLSIARGVGTPAERAAIKPPKLAA